MQVDSYLLLIRGVRELFLRATLELVGQVEAENKLVDDRLLEDYLVEISEHVLNVRQLLHINLEADGPINVKQFHVELVRARQPRSCVQLIEAPNLSKYLGFVVLFA